MPVQFAYWVTREMKGRYPQCDRLRGQPVIGVDQPRCEVPSSRATGVGHRRRSQRPDFGLQTQTVQHRGYLRHIDRIHHKH